MANLTESPIYEPGIFQLEKSTPALGGAPLIDSGIPSAGHANAQGLQLANRTAYLKQQVDSLDSRTDAVEADVTSLDTRLDTAEFDIDTLQSQVTANGSAVNLQALLESPVGSQHVGFSQDGITNRTVYQKLKDTAKTPADYGGLQNAIDSMSAAGGGVIFAEGVFGPITIRSGVYLLGTPGKSFIDFSGSVSHIIQTENFDTLSGTNNYTDNTPHNFGIVGFTIRGTSKTAGAVNGLSLYGYNYIIQDVNVTNVSGNGFNLEWGQYGEALFGMETNYTNLRVDGVGQHGIIHKGPHDSCFDKIIIIDAGQKADNTYMGFYSTGYANSRCFNIHVWHRSGTTNRVAWSIWADGSCEFIACHGEGGRKQLYLGGNCVWSGGLTYAPQSTDSQIVVDGSLNRVDLRFFGTDISLDFTMLELGRLKKSERNSIRISANLAANPATKPLVLLTNEFGNTVELLVAGFRATNVTSGTLSYATALKIDQNFPSKVYFNQIPQMGYSVRFDGYGAQAARLVSTPGAADLTYNCTLTPALGLSSQDDASLGYAGIAARVDGIFGVVGTAGSAAKVALNVTPAGAVHLGGLAGTSNVQVTNTTLGFFGKSGVVKPTVTGSRGGNAALASFLAAQVALGLIVDNTTT